MDDRRISYSSGNFSSIERAEAGNPGSVPDGLPARARTVEADAGPESGRDGKTDPAPGAGTKGTPPGTTAGQIGRTGRRHARIRDVANLGAVLAAARMKREEGKQAVSAAPDPFENDRNAPAADPQTPAAGNRPGTPPDAAQGAPAASVVNASIGAVAPDRDVAGTGRGAPPAEEPLPLEVAELEEMSGKRLDLAEFVIQAAVSGDDDRAAQTPWTPEPPDRTGYGGATARADRSGIPGGRDGPTASPGEPLRPGPDIGRYDSSAMDTAGGRSGGNGFAVRRKADVRDAGPSPGPAPSGDSPSDYRNFGPDLSIPMVDEEEIPLVRTPYEEEFASREAGPAESGIDIPPARDGTAASDPAPDPAAEPDALHEAPPKAPETAGRRGILRARLSPGRPTGFAPGSRVPAAPAPSLAAAAAAARSPAAPPDAPEKDGTKPAEPAGSAARKTRQARETGIAASAGGDRAMLGWKRLAARPGNFDRDLRTNLLCGLAIAAALGAVAWYVTGPGTTPPTQTVEAGKTDIAPPHAGKKEDARAPDSTADAIPLRKAPIYRPAKKIVLAAASAVGDLEYRITPKTVDRTVISARGDNFGNMLLRAGVGTEETAQAVLALQKVYDPRTLPIGLELKVIFETPGVGNPRFLGYRFDSSSDRMVHVSRRSNGNFAARKVEKIVTRVYTRADGQIETSLFGAGVKAGVPPRIMLQMVRLFSFAVDFQRDLHGGEKFHIMYRSQMDEAGRIVRHGDIVYASLTVGGKTQKLYLYERPNGGAAQYLNERGQGNRRALMKTPIDGARLTSRFGYRRHPLLGFTKLHSGVDFGARPGTPILAAGNGTIVKIGWFGTFGRYIRIRHGSVYETAYAHMSRFQRGLRVGSRVKQGETIGYVGNSGRSTGPHLHYEVLRNGRHVNPMKIALPSRKNLKGADLKRFFAHRKEVDARYAALGLAAERRQKGTAQAVGSDGAAGCKTGANAAGQVGGACN